MLMNLFVDKWSQLLIRPYSFILSIPDKNKKPLSINEFEHIKKIFLGLYFIIIGKYIINDVKIMKIFNIFLIKKIFIRKKKILLNLLSK